MKYLPLALLAALTLLQLFLATRLPVAPAEAYQWLCAQRLDWAFFDGPGGTAAVLRGTIQAFGDGPLGLRFAFPFFAALATVGAWLFGRALFGNPAGLGLAVALNVAPLFQSSALHAGPEMPALAFLLLSAWAFVRALDRGARWWIAAGIFLMLAAQFQTASALLAIGFALVCLLRRHRDEWRRPGLYLAAALALVGLVPLWLWNQSHDWPALATGTLRTALTPAWAEVPSSLAGIARWLSLPLIAALLLSLFALARNARLHLRPRVVLALAAPFLALSLFLILHASPAAPGILLFSFALTVAAIIPAFLQTTRHRLIGAALLLVSAVSATIQSGSLPAKNRGAAAVDWKSVADRLGSLIQDAQPADAPPLFVIAPDADATAALNYHLATAAGSSRPEVFLRESQDASNQFALWPRYDDFVATEKPADEFFQNEGSVRNPYLGRSALYLTEEEPADLPQTIRSAFGAVTAQTGLDLGGGRKLRVYLCSNYQTMPL